MSFNSNIGKTKHGFLSPFAGSPMHKRKYSDEEILNMKNRRLSGETWQSIANDYGVHRSTIEKLIKTHNPIVNDIKIPKGYATIEEVAEDIGLSKNGLYYHIRTKKIHTIKKNNIVYLSRTPNIIEYERTLNEFQVEAIYELIRKKWSMKKISIALNVNYETVKNYNKLRHLFDKRYIKKEENEMKMTKEEFRKLWKNGELELGVLDTCTYNGVKYKIVTDDKNNTVELVNIED